MAKIVYGKYDTTEEALQAVNALKYKGANGADITILADKADRLKFTKEEPNNDVDTEAATGESFMDKIASFFMLDSTERIEDRLIAKGIDAQESERLANDVENGKILILVDEGAAGVSHSELDDETPNRGGLYAGRNEEKMRQEKDRPETVGNMSRADNLAVTDELSGTADGRMRDSSMDNNDNLGENRQATDRLSDTDNLRNEDTLLQDEDTQKIGAVGNMNRTDDFTVTDDLSVTADDRLRKSTMNDNDHLDRNQTFTDDTDKLRNEENMSQREDRQTAGMVGNMSRADDLSVTDDLSETKEGRNRDSNLNENDDLDKKKTYPKNRIDTDNL